MFNISKIFVVCQLGLLTVSCHVQHDCGSVLQCDSTCILPEFPGNGCYKVLGATADTLPGAVVPNLTVIQYQCDVGYEPYPHSTAVCNGGTWDTQFTKCQKKVTCPLPTNPAHGSYELSDFDCSLKQDAEVPNWTTVIYSCDVTFEIVGNRTALCYNGLWTTEPPQCRKTTPCVIPDPPAKGSYSMVGSLNASVAGVMAKEFQILKYDCPAPNILQGSPVIYCQNGNWLPEVPSCLVNKYCTLPALPLNARINAVKDIDPSLPGIQVPSMSVVEYSCDELFDLIGTAKITCLNGSWSSEPPHCQKSKYCILPALPTTGSYSIVGSVEAPAPGAAIAENKALLYKCTTNNKDPTDQVIICFKGKWLPGVVECALPTDCGDVSGTTSGVYVIQPTRDSEPFEVYCDLTLHRKKWTVIQRRFNSDVDFYRNYTEYSGGFGRISGNHWVGLKHIHEITKGGHHELYVDLEAHNGTKAYARYDTFSVGNSSTGFKLTISGYTGTAGDSMTEDNGGYNMNGMKFSTFDKDQDMWRDGNCAEYRHGAWWFNDCSDNNLNGPYHDTIVADWRSMYWYYKYGWTTLKTVRMLIRRK